jgi:RNA polymerase sigma factor (sigma-70 family)
MARWSPSDPHTDRTLVEGLHEGNTTALTTLYDTYAARLYDYCLSVVGETAIAVDIVHDVMIDACHRAPRLRTRARLRSWLYGAARRRCLQRGRAGGLHWNEHWRVSTPGGANEPGGTDSSLSRAELRELLDAVLARLEFADQETLLLALRHDLTGPDLAAMLGVSGRRAGSCTARARSRALVAVAAEQQVFTRRCAEKEQRGTRAREVAEAEVELAGHAARRSAGRAVSAAPVDAADATLTAHTATCPACRRRDQLTVAALLESAPTPTPPASLRHRVLHTGADPELAGYRSDIAGRGGSLTPDGLPRQPDVPTSTNRRWTFLAGGIIGALVTALIAAVIIGPVMGRSDLYWSFRPHLEPSTAWPEGPPAAGTPTPPLAVGRKPPSSVAGPRQPSGLPSPQVPGGGPSPSAGRLVLSSTSVRFQAGDRIAYVDLSASLAPVTWNAVVSSTRITISEAQGTIPAGGRTRLAVVLDRAQIEFPGAATITLTTGLHTQQAIEVTWAGSLLS